MQKNIKNCIFKIIILLLKSTNFALISLHIYV